MSTTYKPALLKALVWACRRSDSLDIALHDVGYRFAQMYWNQAVVFHLRQAAVISKEAEVVRRLRSVAERYGVRRFDDVPAEGVAQMQHSMANVLRINVLNAFHASKPDEMPTLYDWSKGDDCLHLAKTTHAFLKGNAAVLELLANYFWADYLERCNMLVPRVIQKVAREGATRRSLSKYLGMLMGEDGGACFYCERPFSPENPPLVDHVIPWSFLLDDPLWDLVVACSRCNGSKADWLPNAIYIDRLSVRNSREMKARVGEKMSLLAGSEDMERLFQAAVAVEWPRFWSPRQHSG